MEWMARGVLDRPVKPDDDSGVLTRGLLTVMINITPPPSPAAR